MKKCIIFILSIGIIYASCTKGYVYGETEETTRLQGRFITNGSGDPLAGYKVDFYTVVFGAGDPVVGSPGSKKYALQSIVLDDNGGFDVTLTGPGAPSFHIYDDEKYNGLCLNLDTNDRYYTNYTTGKENLNIEWCRDPKAWYSLDIVPTSRIDTIVWVEDRNTLRGKNVAQLTTKNYRRYNFKRANIDYPFRVIGHFDNKPTTGRGNNYYYYDIVYKRDGEWTTIRDSVYLKQFETRKDTLRI